MSLSRVDFSWFDQSKIPLENRIYRSLESLRIDFGVQNVGDVVKVIDWEPLDKTLEIGINHSFQSHSASQMMEIQYVVTAYLRPSTKSYFFKLVKV